MNYYARRQDDVLSELDVDSENGLTDKQVKENLEKYGSNTFSRKEKISIFRRIIEAVKEPMLLMLVFAGVIALTVNIIRFCTGGEYDFLEVVGIFVAISISVIITLIMEGKSAKAFETLTKLNDDITVKVIRNKEIIKLLKKDIVVGDIVLLESGDKVPADGRLIESTDLCVNESMLTGESEPVEKNANITLNEMTPIAERINMIYSGCFIVSGKSKMIITEVGDNTEFGKIAQELGNIENTSTPLQEKLAKLGKIISLLGCIMAGIVFLVQLITFICTETMTLENISNAFITSIVLIVAAVPEGLPTIVAVSLAINIIKMAKQNSLVKKMIACETVGCINIICSDKTGTLTKNQMVVSKIFERDKIIEPEQLTNEYLIKNFSINSTADIKKDKDEKIEFIGNPTECALITVIDKIKKDYRKIRKESKIEYVYPFSSETKNMTTIIKEKDTIVYTKGSPEKIISMCNMDNKAKKDIEEKIEEFQKEAYRVIAFAHKNINEKIDYKKEREKIEKDLIYDGFVAISDPLREDVFEAVQSCKMAGIDLKILTGDNIVTAIAIAKQLNILGKDYKAVETSYINGLSDKELKKELNTIRVIARSTPKLKMRIVKLLKEEGNVVAVTGDGINDAPALKNADVGIAMGIAGTEVSKEASDMVLLDDSFSTIVKAIRWGRGIFKNFQRFIQFQLTVNLSSVITVLFSIILGYKSPFTALQLLWINIIMDGPPALTLGLEPIRENLMKNKPTPRDESIISKTMIRRIVINGLYISSVFLAQTKWNFIGGTNEESSTILFVLFVIFQLFNAFNCRELGSESIFKNICNNKLMLSVFGVTFLLQILITQFASAFFGTVPLSIEVWGKIILLSITIIGINEIVKIFERRYLKQ